MSIDRYNSIPKTAYKEVSNKYNMRDTINYANHSKHNYILMTHESTQDKVSQCQNEIKLSPQ